LKALPTEPGVYEVKTDYVYRRLKGDTSSPIVIIGRAENIQKRRQQKADDPVKNLHRAEKWLLHGNHVLKFRYYICGSFEEAKLLEAVKLWEYENQYWELPPGNEKLEQPPIIKLIKNKYQSIEKLVDGLDKGIFSPAGVADTLGLPTAIIQNCIIYWGKIKKHLKL